MRQGKYAKVNDLNLYYEVHSSGEPLLLLHGGFGLVDMFDRLIPFLAQSRSVIPVELQGHGRTADIDRPFSFERMADDIAGLIPQLGYKKADILGYSVGGGVAYQTAIHYPEVVRKLVAISAPVKRKGWYPDVLTGMESISAEALSGSPIQAAYTSVAPNPDHWPHLVMKTRQLLSEDYDWSAGVSKIQAPTLIVIGDTDSINPAHALEIFKLLGAEQPVGAVVTPFKSQLAILPGTTHFNILDRVDLLQVIIPQFLDMQQRRQEGTK